MVSLGLAALPDDASAQPKAAASSVQIVPETRHTQWVNSTAISADGRLLATSGDDQLIKLWDVSSGRLIRNVLRVPREVKFWRVETLSSDGTRLLGIESTDYKLWDTLIGKALLSLPNTSTGDGHSGVVLSADGKRVAGISPAGAATLYDAATGKELAALTAHGGGVTAVAFSADGRLLATGGQDRVVRIWDGLSGRPMRTLGEGREPVTAASFATGGQRLLTRGGTELRVLEVDRAEPLWQREAKAMASATMTADGRLVVIELKDGQVEVWDPAANKLVSSVPPPAGGTFLGLSASGERLIFGPRQRADQSGEAAWIARYIDAATGRVAHTVEGEGESVWADGRYLYVVTDDNALILRELDSGREVRKLAGQPALTAIAFAASGTRVATAGPGRVSIRDAETGRRTGSCPAGAAEVRALAYSPDGRQLLLGGEAGAIALCDLEAGRLLLTFQGHDHAIRSLAFSADGKSFLAGDGDGNVKNWTVAAGRPLWSRQGSSGRAMLSVSFSPDGKLALAGTDDNRVRIIDAASGRELRVLRFLIGPVWTVAVSPDGKRVAAAGYSEVLVKQWDMQTGKELQRLDAGLPPGRFVGVDSIRFSSGGAGLMAAVANTHLVVWNAGSGRKLLAADSRDQEMKSVTFAREGRRVTTVDEAGAIRHWDITNGALLATIIPFGDDEWLAVTPEGFFDASAKGEERLSVVRGLDAQPVGALRGQLHRPDLVAAKIKGDPKGEVRAAAAKLDLGR
jgi:WD40 repeat protein